jgi:cytochrome c oxidase cbb3-type subunit 3
LAQSSNKFSAIATAVLAAALPLLQLPAAASAPAQTAATVSWHESSQRDNSAPAMQSDNTGRQTFISSCALCHGLDGRGGEHAPNIATNPAVQQLSDAELLRIIENGIPAGGMPGFQSLGPSTLKTVVAYVRILQGKHSAAALPGNPERGRQLFFGKAACSSCHMIRGQGGFIGADLSSYAQTHSPQEIREAILNPNKDIGPKRDVVIAVTRDGRKYVGVARNEDNFSLQLQTLNGAFHLLMKSDLAALRHEPRSLMPSDYGSKLTKNDLDDLIKFLVKSSQEQP